MSGFCHLPPYSVSFQPMGLSECIDWGIAAYGIPPLWASTRGVGVTVAVLDTGIATHSALVGTVIDHRNFTSDPELQDTLGHGTHVAGIIAAHGPRSGIAPACNLLSLKVLGHSGMGSNDAVATAVRYAVDAKVDLISMSLGSNYADDHVHQAICYASQAGTPVVCAAGNDGGLVDFPAAFKETISVGAVDETGVVCEFSSRGKEIVVAAPGHNITSTWLADGYATISGTSMAAPFVSGVLALYISQQKAQGLPHNPTVVTQALISTCTDVGAVGRDDVYGWGLVNPHGMMGSSVAVRAGGITIFIPGGKIL